MRLPLFDQHAALGADFIEEHGISVPRAYGDWRDEHAAVRRHVGLIDCSDAGRLQGAGPDMAGVLQGVVTNEVKHVPTGAGCLACLLNDVGRAQTLLGILRTDDGFFIETPAGLGERSRDLIDYYIITEDAEIVDVSADWGQLSLQGPQSRAVIESVLGATAPDVALPEYTHAVTADGIRIVRRARSGEDGYDLWAAVPALNDLWSRLHAAVTQAGGRAVGREALNVLRIEASLVRYGVDLDENTIPLETGLYEAISENKGCYLGQEIIARIINLSKPLRKFVGFYPPDGTTAGTKVTAADKDVGRLTSVTWSPTLNKTIALGYLRTDVAARKEAVFIEGQSTEILPLPFYRAEHAPVPVVPPSPNKKLVTGFP